MIYKKDANWSLLIKKENDNDDDYLPVKVYGTQQPATVG